MKHFIMDASGHSTIEFDETNKRQLAKANERFNMLLREGKTPATRKQGDKDYKVIKDPNKQEDETLFVSPMQGG